MAEIAALGGILAGYLAILHLLPAPRAEGSLPWLRLILPNVWLLGTSVVFARFRPVDLRWVRPGRRWRVGAVAVAAAAALVLLAAALWPAPAVGSRPAPMGATLLLVLAVPVAEEVYFRGVLLSQVRRLTGPVGAVIAVSALFAVLHLPSGAVGPMFVVSLVLCSVTLVSGSVLWAVLLHLGWNALAVTVTLAPGTDRWTLSFIAVMVMGIAATTAVWRRH